jgi:hypothetical protein
MSDSGSPVLSVIQGTVPYQYRLRPDGVRIFLGFPLEVTRDLEKSGLTPPDMRIRMMDEVERNTLRIPNEARGYVIPYYRYDGTAIDFYRVRILNARSEDGKYRQPQNSANHVYFPPNFLRALHSWLGRHSATPLLVITEGEKKAAAACSRGIPTVAFSGVDSWRTRTVELPKGTKLTATPNGKAVRASLPNAKGVPEVNTEQRAEGFTDLIDIMTQFDLTAVICYDSDSGSSWKTEVAVSAALLAYDLRYLGFATGKIKKLVLPSIGFAVEKVPTEGDGSDTATGMIVSAGRFIVNNGRKTGLDDFIVVEGGNKLTEMLVELYNDPGHFPQHPRPEQFISKHLNGFLDRKTGMQVSAVLLSELDSSGVRFRDKYNSQPYYYDRPTHRLMQAPLAVRGAALHQSEFGNLLYQKYGVTTADSKFVQWLASQFMGEKPIFEVVPKRIKSLITVNEDVNNELGIAIQASDSHFFAVGPMPGKSVELCVNGSKGILFEQGHVEPLDYDRVLQEFTVQASNAGPMEFWWHETVQQTNLGRQVKGWLQANLEEGTAESFLTPEGERMQMYAALLSYVSPYLQRWRGLQLPIEMLIGEAGSGKSSLFELRLSIMTGRPRLRGLPSDLREWTATLANSGGLVCIDNVNFADQKLRQRMSDELCRLVTEPNPTVETRTLYTTADVTYIPIDCTFGFTAIQQPFQNADLFQRSATFQMCAAGRSPNSNWVADQLDERGGREAWVAHHLLFLHKFLRIAQMPASAGGWDYNYKATHRLAHLEQVLTIAGRVFGLQTHDISELCTTIREVQQQALNEGDWVFSGLKEFLVQLEEDGFEGRFRSTDITSWAAGHEDYKGNPVLNSPRKLGKYLKQHMTQLTKALGIIATGQYGNSETYAMKDDPLVAELMEEMRQRRLKESDSTDDADDG